MTVMRSVQYEIHVVVQPLLMTVESIQECSLTQIKMITESLLVFSSFLIIRWLFCKKKGLSVIINIFQQQMNKYNRNGDSVAASQLLKALNTLQLYNCNEENDLSFGEHTFKVQTKSQKTMNFQIYMEKQTDKSRINPKNNSQKSVSPMKDMTRSFAKTSELSHNKRKSLTPATRCNASTILTKKIAQEKEAKNKQIDKQNRQKNLQKTLSVENTTNSKVSSFSKKILDQSQKKGNAYVPIHLRAEGLLKERQAKLAKLQKQKQIEKMIEQKQCTFKPKISKSVKHVSQIKKNEKDMKQNKQDKIQVKMIQQIVQNASVVLEAADEIYQPTEVKHLQQKQQEVKLVKEEPKVERIGFKKYKNQKFNSLLDFLH